MNSGTRIGLGSLSTRFVSEGIQDQIETMAITGASEPEPVSRSVFDVQGEQQQVCSPLLGASIVTGTT